MPLLSYINCMLYSFELIFIYLTASFYSEPDWQLTRDRLLIPSRAESSQSVVGVDSFIMKTREQIPSDAEKVRVLR